MKVELNITTPEGCGLRVWCVQQFKIRPRKRRYSTDEKPYLLLDCVEHKCVVEAISPFEGTSPFQAYFDTPPSIERIRKMLCVIKEQ